MNRVADHELLEEIGRGGMGSVHRARHLPTGAIRAVKLVDGPGDVDWLERFRIEAMALARVAGRGVVPVHASGIDRGRLYIIMDLVPGGSLRDVLKREGRLPWPRAVKIVRELARVLDRCAGAGLVHRDVKPENVFLDESGEPLLGDFGCARDLNAETLTATGTLMGTVIYMAPEQLAGERAGPEADVYALGTLLHELVTGARPFGATKLLDLHAEIVARRHEPASAIVGSPRALDEAIERALEPEVARRASAADLVRLLGAIEARPVARSRAPLLLGALPLIAGAVAFVALDRPAPVPEPAPSSTAPVASASPVTRALIATPSPLTQANLDDLERFIGNENARAEHIVKDRVVPPALEDRARAVSKKALALARKLIKNSERLDGTQFLAGAPFLEIAWRLDPTLQLEPDDLVLDAARRLMSLTRTYDAAPSVVLAFELAVASSPADRERLELDFAATIDSLAVNLEREGLRRRSDGERVLRRAVALLESTRTPYGRYTRGRAMAAIEVLDGKYRAEAIEAAIVEMQAAFDDPKASRQFDAAREIAAAKLRLGLPADAEQVLSDHWHAALSKHGEDAYVIRTSALLDLDRVDDALTLLAQAPGDLVDASDAKDRETLDVARLVARVTAVAGNDAARKDLARRLRDKGIFWYR